jgi:hypothetical protein
VVYSCSEFLDTSVASQHSLILAEDPQLACTLLNHYLYCKREDPEHTSAIVVVPDPAKAPYTPFLKGTIVLGSISA